MSLLVPEFLQTKTYAAQRMRYALQHMKPGLAEHAIAPADMLVTQRGAGANMSVDVAAGAVFVQGDDTARQGFYHLVNDAAVNAVVGAAHATLPRIDQVVARVYDSSILGVTDVPAIEVIAGTPTAGAQSTDPLAANYRLGAAALPNGAMLLADVQVDALAASIVTAKINDKRQRTRGSSSIATAEARTNTAYGALATPDRVPNIVVPTADSIVLVTFDALWQNSVANAGRAALFIGATQLKTVLESTGGAGPVTQAATCHNDTGIYARLMCQPTGLSGVDNAGGTATGSDVTTGQLLARYTAYQLRQEINGTQQTIDKAAGPMIIKGLAAGTYDFAVLYKSSSGSVTVKERKLNVHVLNPADMGM